MRAEKCYRDITYKVNRKFSRSKILGFQVSAAILENKKTAINIKPKKRHKFK